MLSATGKTLILNAAIGVFAVAQTAPLPAQTAFAMPIAGATPSLSVPGLDAAPVSEAYFGILVADLAARRGAWDIAAGTSMELARATRDARLARMALEYAMSGDMLSEALDAAELWLELEPANPEAREARMILAAVNGSTIDLVQHLRTFVQQSPDKAEAIVQAQQILSRLSDKQLTFNILDMMLEGDVRDLPDARASLAQAAFDAGNGRRALSEARTALALLPGWDFAAAMVLQFGLHVEPEAVLASTRHYIAMHPGAFDLRLDLVDALAQRGEIDGALAELRAMRRHSPEDLELLYLQGAVNYAAGRTRDAEKWLTKYIRALSDRLSDVAAHADWFAPSSSLEDAQLLLARIVAEDGRFGQAYDILGRMDSAQSAFVPRMRQAIARGKQGRAQEAVQILDSVQPEGEHERTLLLLTREHILREKIGIDVSHASVFHKTE